MTRLQRLERECDQLWQEAQMHMWNGHCAKCKKLNWMNGAGHHIIKRRVHATRYAMMNGIYLCDYKCHTWAEHSPFEFSLWLQQAWPPLWTWHVQHRNPDPVRFTEAFLLETRTSLKQVVKELG